MYQVIRYIDNLGGGVWSVVAEACNMADAEHARDFFEANWPWADTGVDGKVHYSYEVHKVADDV